MMRFALALSALLLVSGGAMATSTAARTMTDDDFFLDRKSLIGKRVEVPSNFKTAGDIVFMSLKDESNATFVNIEKLTRDNRKDIYLHCQELCRAMVQGVVAIIASPLGNDVGIIADHFTLAP